MFQNHPYPLSFFCVLEQLVVVYFTLQYGETHPFADGDRSYTERIH